MANEPTYIECICTFRKTPKARECGFNSATKREMKNHIISQHHSSHIANHTAHYYRLKNPEKVALSWKARFSHWLNQENERKAQEKMAQTTGRIAASAKEADIEVSV